MRIRAGPMRRNAPRPIMPRVYGRQRAVQVETSLAGGRIAANVNSSRPPTFRSPAAETKGFATPARGRRSPRAGLYDPRARCCRSDDAVRRDRAVPIRQTTHDLSNVPRAPPSRIVRRPQDGQHEGQRWMLRPWPRASTTPRPWYEDPAPGFAAASPRCSRRSRGGPVWPARAGPEETRRRNTGIHDAGHEPPDLGPRPGPALAPVSLGRLQRAGRSRALKSPENALESSRQSYSSLQPDFETS
jgi:hypothetical protein